MSSSNCLLSLQTFLHHSTLDSAASRHKPDRTQKENKTRQDIDKTETIQGPLWIIMSRCPGKRTLAPTDSCSIFETGQAPRLRLRQTKRIPPVGGQWTKRSMTGNMARLRGTLTGDWPCGDVLWPLASSPTRPWVTLPVSTITGLMTGLLRGSNHNHHIIFNILSQVCFEFTVQNRVAVEDAWQEFTLVFHLRYP